MSQSPGETIEAVVALIHKAESRRGALWCHVTTFELRQAMGLDVENWPPLP